MCFCNSCRQSHILQNVPQIRATKEDCDKYDICFFTTTNQIINLDFERKPTTEISFNFSPCHDSILSCVCSRLQTVLLQTIKRKWMGVSEECVCISLVIASLLPFIHGLSRGGLGRGIKEHSYGLSKVKIWPMIYNQYNPTLRQKKEPLLQLWANNWVYCPHRWMFVFHYEMERKIRQSLGVQPDSQWGLIFFKQGFNWHILKNQEKRPQMSPLLFIRFSLLPRLLF